MELHLKTFHSRTHDEEAFIKITFCRLRHVVAKINKHDAYICSLSKTINVFIKHSGFN